MTNGGKTMSTDGIPVTVHLDGDTFRRLEVIAKKKGSTVRGLIVAVTRRALEVPAQQPREPGTRLKRGMGSRLTPQEVQRIRDLTAAGVTAMEVATIIGCHHRTVEDYRLKFRREAENV